jgi:hypothetical protein
LPEILTLKVERIPFKPPEYKYVKSAYAGHREALAFTLEIRGDLHLERNATPVLYVGDVQLADAERMEDGRVRYLAFPDHERRMERGAPVALGWPGFPLEKRESRHRYEPPEGGPRKRSR